MSSEKAEIFRSEILHFLTDPVETECENSYQHFPDGLLIVKNGKVDTIGHTEDLLPTLPSDIAVTHYPDNLIIPGFIDCHIHYPQTEIIGSYGEQLLDWLEDYAFPAEREFINTRKASEIADFFLEELLRNGTTTAMVFGTVHKNSVDAFFNAAARRNLRMICGKVLMDRNAPADLVDSPETGYRESRELAERWHEIKRMRYAVTPRFAPTSSNEQLAMAGKFLKEIPGLYLQTHLAENLGEIRWVEELFPERSGYLDVYEHYGLITKRSVFAHCIHLSDNEFETIRKRGAGIAFCPSSNLFLGSGLFDLATCETKNINVGMASDVGGGTSFSMLQTLSDGYKTQQLRRHRLSPLQSFYLATLGGARTLDLDDTIGNFEPGKEADFIVLDYKATPLLEKRLKRCKNLTEKLFVLQILGDDRTIKHVHILGEMAYTRQ